MKLFLESKNDNRERKNKPYLVACTGFVNQEVHRKAIESGFDMVVEQPLNVQIFKD